MRRVRRRLSGRAVVVAAAVVTTGCVTGGEPSAVASGTATNETTEEPMRLRLAIRNRMTLTALD